MAHGVARPRELRLALAAWAAEVAQCMQRRSAVDLAQTTSRRRSSALVVFMALCRWRRTWLRARRGRIAWIRATAAATRLVLTAWRNYLLRWCSLHRAVVLHAARRNKDATNNLVTTVWLLWCCCLEPAIDARCYKRRSRALLGVCAATTGRRLLLEVMASWRCAAAGSRQAYWTAADLRWRSRARDTLEQPWHRRSSDFTPCRAVLLTCWVRWRRLFLVGGSAKPPRASAQSSLRRLVVVASPCRSSAGAEERTRACELRRRAVAEARRAVELHVAHQLLRRRGAEVRPDDGDVDFAHSLASASRGSYKAATGAAMVDVFAPV